MTGKKDKQARKEARDKQKAKEKLLNRPFGLIKTAMASPLGLYLSGKKQWDEISNDSQKLCQKIMNSAKHPERDDHTNEMAGKQLVGIWRVLFTDLSESGINGMTPSHDMCEMMRNTEITFEGSAFKLPYDVFVISLPMNMHYNFKYAFMKIVDNNLMIFFFSEGRLQNILGSPGEKFSFFTAIKFSLDGDMQQTFNNKQIEDTVTFGEDGDSEIADLTRICINSVHFLLSRKPEDVNVQDVEFRATTKLPIINPEIEIKQHGFVQQIKIKTETKVYGKDGQAIPTGTIMAPHWRRGHWRTQHHGEGNKQEKQIFIQPVYINSTYFKGDKSDTGANYK